MQSCPRTIVESETHYYVLAWSYLLQQTSLTTRQSNSLCTNLVERVGLSIISLFRACVIIEMNLSINPCLESLLQVHLILMNSGLVGLPGFSTCYIWFHITEKGINVQENITKIGEILIIAIWMPQQHLWKRRLSLLHFLCIIEMLFGVIMISRNFPPSMSVSFSLIGNQMFNQCML